jgi:hypothetical protein
VAITSQSAKKLTAVILAALITATGAAIVSKAATEMVHAAVAPRQGGTKQTTPAPSKRLAGVVRDDEGRPVAGATVVAGQFGGGKPNHRTGTTGPDGRFELTPAGDSARLDYVVAHHEGLTPASHLRGPRDEQTEERDVVLTLAKPAPFMGVVRDRAAKAIVGATVRIQYAEYPGSDGPNTRLNVIEPIVLGTPLKRLFRTTTDAQGRFLFSALPRGAKASLAVTALGMGEYSTVNRVGPKGETEFLAGSSDAPAEVVLTPEARVVGRVMTRFSSIKVVGLKVAMQGSHGHHGIWAETRTDPEGRFEFTGLPEGTANIFLMDHPNDGPWTYRAAADTALRSGGTAEVVIELIRGVQVEGRVVDARNGNPVPEVGVGVYGPMRPRSGPAIISAKTDHAGRYRFRLPPGQTIFYICGPVPAEYGREPEGGHSVNIPTASREFTVPDIEIRPSLPEPSAD